jgi:ketosteroid isomerase-like protein
VESAIDVVRAAFAALERGDTETAFSAFAPSLVYRLHGGHAFAGEFAGKPDALAALGRLAQAGGAGTTLRHAGSWPAGDELVLVHLVRRAGADRDGGPIESDMATILRVENGAITEMVTVSSRALDAYWSTAG